MTRGDVIVAMLACAFALLAVVQWREHCRRPFSRAEKRRMAVGAVVAVVVLPLALWLAWPMLHGDPVLGAESTTTRPGYVTTTTDLATSTSWSTTTTEGATLIPPVTVTRPDGDGAAAADWLSRTGSSTGRVALAGIGLVVAATAVLLAARRRRRKASS